MGQAIDFTGVSCKQQNGWDQKVAGVLHFTECVSQWKGTDKTKKNLVSGCFSNAYAPNWIAWKHGKFKGSASSCAAKCFPNMRICKRRISL